MEKKNAKWKEIIKVNADNLRSAFEKKGIAGLIQTIAHDLDQWKNESINIAILGQSRVGKSSFINALLNLSGDDKGAARVGSADEILDPQFYIHPKNDKVRIWDYPGVGSRNISKEEYLGMIDFSIFDFFIIISSKRFTENDIWLAKEVENSGKFFYFVRSMFGNDIENESRQKRNQKLSRDVLVKRSMQRAFDDCKENLKDFKCEDKIFILDSYEKCSYDFEKLEARLIQNALEISDEKHLAITSCLAVTTKSSLDEKKVVLQKRIPKIALRAAFSLRIKDTDLMILKEEVEFYKLQFNLNERSLKRDIKISNMQEMLSDIKLELQDVEARAREMDEYNEIDSLIPFLPFINIRKTYKASKIWLKKTLDMIANSAAEINTLMLDTLAQQREIQ